MAYKSIALSNRAKYNMFGVSCSNLSTKFVYGLPERHWHNNKTADTLIVMLHYGI
eukprot:IDg5442t1